MKKGLFVIILILAMVCILVACDKDTSLSKVEITTQKAGKIDVAVYSQNDDKSVSLSPLVGTTDKSITDDGNGLYRIITRTEGEGTLVTSTDKAAEGTTITFAATPATNWRFVSVSVNGEIVQNNGTSFVMPSSEATVVATFADMRHAVILGDHIVAENWGEPRDDYFLTTAYTLVAGQRYEFTVDYNEVGHYYEDEDVVCRVSETEQVDVTKVGDGRYAFVAPDDDCWVTVNTHEYRHIDAVKVFTSSYDWGIYSEEDYTDDFTVSITVDGQPYTYGEKVRDGKTASVTLSCPYTFSVKKISCESKTVAFEQRHNSIGQGHNSFGQSRNSYVFILDFSAETLRINIEINEESYPVGCAQTQNGSVSVNKDKAFAGETVTVTATPDEGYYLYSLAYTTDGSRYTDIEQKDGVFAFACPSADVTVKARFVSENAIACTVIAVEYNGVAVNLADAVASFTVADESYPLSNEVTLFFEESQIGNGVELLIVPSGSIYGVQYVNDAGNYYGEVAYNEWGDGTVSIYLYVMDVDFGIVLKV